MPADVSPDHVLEQLEKERLSPYYLFFGPSEFQLEMVLNKIRETFVPETARDFNLQVFYAETGESKGPEPADIIAAARTLPFMSPNRLVIVRRTDNFSAAALETFLPYLENPVDSTCLIFISSKADFRTKFYRRIKDLGRAVQFRNLNEARVVPWIKRMAKDIGLDMQTPACIYLHQVIGDRSMDLYSELEKLYLRYGNRTIGMEEVKALTIYSRIHTIFELMDEISSKAGARSASVLKRFLEEEGKEEVFGILGMLNRQMRLLWQTKSVLERGWRSADVARKLHLQPFQVKKLTQQVRNWSSEELERAFHLLYQADGLLKSGAKGHLVLENIIFSLCA
jgi:DNA polymerase-3 subunit delta